MDDALEYAASLNAEARGSADCVKGIDSFLNKEKIKW
jgi:methylglutaconyl-CoA hydratase